MELGKAIIAAREASSKLPAADRTKPDAPKSKTICRSSGRTRKEAGQRAVAAASAPFIAHGLAVLQRFEVGSVITTESVRKKCRIIPERPNAWGALMMTAARQGLIRRDGWKAAERPEARHRVIALWRRIE